MRACPSEASAGVLMSTPMRSVRSPARAVSGHATAELPTNEMKSRRLMCPQIEGPNLPYCRGAETALCNTAKSSGRGPVRVKSPHYGAAALLSASPQLAESIRAAKRFRVVPIADISAFTRLRHFVRSVLLDPLVPDLRRRATSSRCRGARAGDCRDLLQQRFLRLRQIERITVGLMISGASVPVDLDQIFFQISEIKGE